jgi:hypothetical protein
MKIFNVNASKLTIEFICEKTNEQVVLVFDDMPIPNYTAETIKDGENSTEQEFAYENGRSYKVVVYKNTAEGNVEVFDTTEEEFEINDFELFEEE